MRGLDKDEELIVKGLMRDGWNEARARQHVIENRFRRRSRMRSGGGTSPSSTDGLNSNHVNQVLHAPQSIEEREACLLNGRVRS